ncbi:MAG TPA: hypothetical protein VNT75_19695 [Symbiobacteriaceae bacterium]|nr:hypothetical protein [Symbiobacteriaceae bacterium]
MKRRAAFIILAAALLFSPVTAQAGGPALAAEETTPGGSLRPVGDTTISVLEQLLVIDLREREGRIRATYQLKNPTDRPNDLSVAFPVPPWVLGEWKVSVTLDGRPFTVGNALGPVVLKDGERALASAWLDPFTGEAYQPIRTREPVRTEFLIFGVAFEPGQIRQLSVEYLQLPGQDYGRFLEPVRRFDYLLQPARHWNGYGQLNLQVLAPVGVPLRSETPLRPAGPGQYEATLEQLPAGNLSIFLAPGGGPRWWWDRTGRSWFLVALALLGAALAEVAAVSLGTRLRSAGLLVSLLTWALLYVAAPPHLLRPDPTGVMFLWLLFIPGLMVAHILGRSLIRRIVAAVWRNRREGAGV